jgi:hypothetical protein
VLKGLRQMCSSIVLETLFIFLCTVVSFLLLSTCTSKHPLFLAPCFSYTDLQFECSLIFQVNVSPVSVCKKASILEDSLYSVRYAVCGL